MIKNLLEGNMFIYIMLGLCLIGAIIKLVLELVYLRLVKASENMGTSKNKLVQSMKKKFEAFYKLRIGVNNVDIFVDKYILRHRFCGLLLSTWENICGQIVMLCVLIGSISTVLGLIYESGKQEVLSTFTVGLFTTGLLILLEGIINISGKKEILRLNMKDYLENYLKVKLEQGLDQPELLEQYKKEMNHLEGSLNDAVSSTAATKEDIKQKVKAEKSNKLEQKKKLKQNKQRKALEVKKAKKQKKAEKKRLRELKKEELRSKKLAMKEEQDRIKKEAKAAIERKREADRLELERIKAEVRAEDEKKKQEKHRQEEMKRVLSLEKQLEKEEKKKFDSKTIAQEKKETLLREINERRNYKTKEEELAEKEALLQEQNAKELQIDVAKEVAATKEVAVRKEVAKGKIDHDTKVRLHTAIKKGINNNEVDDKLIEDILKEFLA